MACTPQAVATDASCFVCQPEKQLQGMMVYLLAQIAAVSVPGMNVTPQALSDASTCYTCYFSGKGLLGAAVYLLCQIMESGGSGTGSVQVYTGAAPPAAPANPLLPAIWYPTGGGRILQWTGAAWV